MYHLYSFSETEKSILSYFESNLDEDFQLICLTLNLYDNLFLQDLNKLIVQMIKEKNFVQYPIKEIDKAMKEFFVELNWILYSKFNKQETNFEFGLSLFFGIIKKDKLYYTQFGRMLCGKLEQDVIIPLGKKWDNFNIKAVEDLFLLGSKDEDIFVKTMKLELNSEELFFAIPAFQTEELNTNNNIYTLKREIRKLYRRQHFPYVILSSTKIANLEKTPLYLKIWRNLFPKNN